MPILLITSAWSPDGYAAIAVSGGTEVGTESQRGYLALESYSPSDSLRGFVHRFVLGWRSYEVSPDGTSAEVRSPDVEYTLGYRTDFGHGWLGGHLGLSYRDTRVEPRKLEDGIADENLRIGVHLDGEVELTPHWRAGASLDTYPQVKGFVARGRLLREMRGGLAVGPEVMLEGDEEHRAQQVGLLLQSTAPRSGLEVAAKAGVQRDHEGNTGGYVGFEFELPF